MTAEQNEQEKKKYWRCPDPRHIHIKYVAGSSRPETCGQLTGGRVCKKCGAPTPSAAASLISGKIHANCGGQIVPAICKNPLVLE